MLYAMKYKFCVYAIIQKHNILQKNYLICRTEIFVSIAVHNALPTHFLFESFTSFILPRASGGRRR